ncbi:hypothetical protein AKJ62_04065 [candidate division MSBL1 archaeon SCGC-AAA259D14]|uniref:Uncharacterized protein n=1 Tax=candidate division MSBL1 archaeon SCGC-AAA259D14 TaxID=1698261 RepID=A0A133U458_9EURY|nr:hypothetical protein AKJ62_04065 [candidate division MSBL1 archaeon SCGC-AAA259D14]
MKNQTGVFTLPIWSTGQTSKNSEPKQCPGAKPVQRSALPQNPEDVVEDGFFREKLSLYISFYFAIEELIGVYCFRVSERCLAYFDLNYVYT